MNKIKYKFPFYYQYEATIRQGSDINTYKFTWNILGYWLIRIIHGEKRLYQIITKRIQNYEK